MNLSQFISEGRIEDVPKINKLYHRTNLDSLIKILSSKKLLGFKYPHNVETKIRGHLDPYLQIKHHEIATARKDAFTTIDKSPPEYQERLSLGVGAVEFELYKDRIRTLRSINIEPIDEYRAREREERIVIKKGDSIPLDKKYMIINIKTRELDKDFEYNIIDLGKTRARKKLLVLKELIKDNLEMFNKDVGFNYFTNWLDDKIKKIK